MKSWRRRRRARLASRPFPRAWRSALEGNVPLYRRLPAADRDELERLIQVFLGEKRFEGAGGLRMTDEIRVTIAAHACLLLLHRETEVYPRLSSVIVYPRPYRVRQERRGPAGTVEQAAEVRYGESSTRGAVVLAWDTVLSTAGGAAGCHNVALHEFAHQLDAERGEVDGTPLVHREAAAAWARVLEEAFERLRWETESGIATLLGEYGATSPAEFFAVATECFFSCPAALKRRHPELYDALGGFFRQDPTMWGR